MVMNFCVRPPPLALLGAGVVVVYHHHNQHRSKAQEWGFLGRQNTKPLSKRMTQKHSDLFSVEPKTGVEFPTSADDDLTLAGCGVRMKFSIIPVYAVGLYHANFEPSSDVVKDLKTVRKEFRIVLVRTVERETFVKAIEEQVSYRCTDKKQVQQFADLCAAGLAAKLTTGTTTILRLEPDGRVALTVDGILEGFVYTPQVADALVDTYLGKDSVAPSARKNILDNLTKRAVQNFHL